MRFVRTLGFVLALALGCSTAPGGGLLFPGGATAQDATQPPAAQDKKKKKKKKRRKTAKRGGKKSKPKKKTRATAASADTTDTAGVDANVIREGKTDVKVMEFSGVDIEGRLKSPQLMYFVNRVRAEFDRPHLPHRSFMPELSRSTEEDSLK